MLNLTREELQIVEGALQYISDYGVLTHEEELLLKKIIEVLV